MTQNQNIDKWKNSSQDRPLISADGNMVSQLDAEEILKYISENGLIDIGDVQTQIAQMNLENFINEYHSHRIWKGNDGRWRTYIFDENAPKRRRLVVKKSKDKLLEFLRKLYNVEETIEPEESEEPEATIRNLYPSWLEHKALMSMDSYVTRIQTDWKKYYEHDPIVDVPIRSLNKIKLEAWIMHLIRDNNMTKNCYYNASMIIRQIFQFAFDSEIIETNPFERVKKDLGKFFRRTEKPKDETQVYFDDEIQAIERLAWEDFSVKGKKVYQLAPLAVLFQFYTGLRVSEVCAIKYSDIQKNGKLHVQRMIEFDTGNVRERTKGFAGEREVYLSSKARGIIDATLRYRDEHNISVKEYIFSTDDVPFPERVINRFLKRYCESLGIQYRSSHKLRKTAVSSMVNAGISLNAVREFVGHVDEKTTLKYYTFDRENDEKRNEQFEHALSYSSC